MSHVACLNFKTSRVGVYKCLSLIVSYAVTVSIWPREVVSCRDFILRVVAAFWAMSFVRIYPGRASHMHNLDTRPRKLLKKLRFPRVFHIIINKTQLTGGGMV